MASARPKPFPAPARGLGAASARWRKKSGSVRPARPMLPTVSNSRREGVSHRRPPRPWIDSMFAPPWGLLHDRHSTRGRLGFPSFLPRVVEAVDLERDAIQALVHRHVEDLALLADPEG